MELEWIETLLKRHERENSIARVLDLECITPASEGQNYLSQIRKLKANVILGSGVKAQVPIIMKFSNEGDSNTKLLGDLGLFKHEIEIYMSVLREMENLMEEFGDKREKLWCNCLGYKPYNCIIFQDLTGENFRMEDRTKYLGLKQSLMVVQGLARIHAMSKVLIAKGVLSPNDFKPHKLWTGRSLTENMWGNCLKHVSKAIQEWGNEWVDIGKRMEALVKILPDKMLENMIIDESRFNAMNHGDPWICNFMFKYENSTEDPTALRFIDFQVCYYNSVAFDLIYVMCTSLKPSVRRKESDRLLEAYVKVLNDTLDFYNYKGQRLDLKTLHSELERLSIYQLLFISLTHVIMTSDIQAPFEFDKVFSDEDVSPINLDMFRGDRGQLTRENIGPDLINFKNKGII